MLYDSLEEANNRLLNTIVTYAGEPVYIAQISTVRGQPDFDILYYNFPFDGTSTGRARASDPLFKGFQSPRLGFCNYFTRTPNAAWCERVPSRQRRQGLSSETFAGVTVGGGNRVPWEEVYPSDAFREMVRGEYPPLDTVLERLIPSSCIAVDREFAIRMTSGGYTFLYYKKDEVGVFIRDNLYLRADRQHLIEMITEHPNLPNRVEVM